MRYLKLIEVLALHRRLIERSGGALGIRDFGLLESAEWEGNPRHCGRTRGGDFGDRFRSDRSRNLCRMAATARDFLRIDRTLRVELE